MLKITQKKLISIGKIESNSHLVNCASYRIQSISSDKLFNFPSFFCWEQADKFSSSKTQCWLVKSYPWTPLHIKHKHSWNVVMRKHVLYKTIDGQITNSLTNKIPEKINHPIQNFDQTVCYLTVYGLVLPFIHPNSKLKSQHLTLDGQILIFNPGEGGDSKVEFSKYSLINLAKTYDIPALNSQDL